jgi:hypothetical protein
VGANRLFRASRASIRDSSRSLGVLRLVRENETVTNEREETSEVRIRRSPRYLRFMGAGAVVGVLAALILTIAFPDAGQFTPTQVFGFLLLFLVVIGGGLGAVVALLLDRGSSRRAQSARLERVAPTDGIGEGTPGQPDVTGPSVADLRRDEDPRA